MRKTLSSLVLAAVAVMLAACGGDDADAPAAQASAPTGAFPVTVTDSAGTSVTIPARPERIVSISASLTEMLFAIGAGDQVEAVDEWSNYPPEAPHTSLSAFPPNPEAIAGYRPDLVVLSDNEDDVVDGLNRLSIPVLVFPAAQSLDETYRQIETLGQATGHAEEATALTSEMRQEIDDILSALPDRNEPLTYYHELGQDLYSVTSGTFIGQIYALAGLTNIADEADPDGTGYPQLSAEYLLAADPDFVFLADTKCCGQSLETVAARPGFDELTAVRSGQVVPLDDDIASRWGPRVVDLLRMVADAVAKASVPAA